MEKEYNAFLKNNTWSLVKRSDIPLGALIHHPIWRFKAKSNSILKVYFYFDSQFQTKNTDYFETYSLIVKYSLVHLALTFILAMGSFIELGDVSNTFLNADVDTNVYME